MPDLRELLERATPGEWRVVGRVGTEEPRWNYIATGTLAFASADSEADAALIALAPDLTKLVLEAEEAMRAIATEDEGEDYEPPELSLALAHPRDFRAPAIARAWLARYDELRER